MKAKQIVRAWKDEGYRLSLSDAERSLLPENPAGTIELSDADLAGATGGVLTVVKGCPPITNARYIPHCTSGKLPCCY